MDRAIDSNHLLTRQELKKVIKLCRALDNTFGMCIEFIANTGVRVGESLLVERRGVDFNTPRPQVRVPTLKRKGRPARTVVLYDKEFCKRLKTYMEETPIIEGHYLFEGISKRGVQLNFQRIIDKIGCKKGTGIHILRHTFASRLVAAGADFNFVRQQLGWSSLEMAKIYVHTPDDEIDKIGKGMS